LYRNEYVPSGKRSENHWFHVDLVGVSSNLSGIGARVRIVTGGTQQIREVSGGSGCGCQDSPTVEFGLGAIAVVDTLQVRWPTGELETMTGLAVDQLLVFEQGSMTSVEGVGAVRYAWRFEGGYPNPFNLETTVRYSLPEPQSVNLQVYDVRGRLVRVLVDDTRVEAGRHWVVWDGRDRRGQQAAPGVYFCRLQAGPHAETRRVVLLR
jgi:hypothetical protein